MKFLSGFIMILFFSIIACNNKVEIRKILDTSKNGLGYKPKNIILIIGDGMGLSQISYGMYRNGNYTQLERVPYVGLVKTDNVYGKITDSAAGSTAFSIGKKTCNGAIGQLFDGSYQKTILEYAEENGLSTGLISTSKVTHATPASFIAHNSNRQNYQAIAKDFLKTDIDLVFGGGVSDFSKRDDNCNLLDSLKNFDYKVYEGLQFPDLEINDKVYVLTDPDQPKGIDKGRDTSYLRKAAKWGVNHLSKNDSGFFLMIEAAQIDWECHSNDSLGFEQEQLDFERMLKEVLDFAEKDKNTLVVITADHETGGLGIVGTDKISNDVAVKFINKRHTGTMVPIFSIGPGAESFTGIYSNTAVFEKMMLLFGFKKTEQGK